MLMIKGITTAAVVDLNLDPGRECTAPRFFAVVSGDVLELPPDADDVEAAKRYVEVLITLDRGHAATQGAKHGR